MPAPTAPSVCSRSKILTGNPASLKAMAALSPAMPAPAIATGPEEDTVLIVRPRPRQHKDSKADRTDPAGGCCHEYRASNNKGIRFDRRCPCRDKRADDPWADAHPCTEILLPRYEFFRRRCRCGNGVHRS